MAVFSVNEQQFHEKVLNADKPVLVDFWAPWCGPCRQFSSLIDSVASAHPEIEVAKVNIDEEPDLAQRYRIASVPSLVLFEKGKIKNRAVGLRPRNEIEMMIQ